MKSGQRRAADLLLSLEETFDVERQAARCLEQRLQRQDRGEHVALVVAGAARIDAAIFDHRLERRAVPQFHRIDRLRVEVAVDHNRRLARRVQPVGIDNRMAAGLHDLDMFHAGGLHARRNPVRGATHIGGVGGQRRDAGDTQEIKQLFLETLLMRRQILLPIHTLAPCCGLIAADALSYSIFRISRISPASRRAWQ
jgi:hypothetical protein